MKQSTSATVVAALLWPSPSATRAAFTGRVVESAGNGPSILHGKRKGERMDDEVISVAALKELPEYSCSMPTGTTIGKRWRRNIHWHQPDVQMLPCLP